MVGIDARIRIAIAHSQQARSLNAPTADTYSYRRIVKDNHSYSGRVKDLIDLVYLCLHGTS